MTGRALFVKESDAPAMFAEVALHFFPMDLVAIEPLSVIGQQVAATLGPGALEDLLVSKPYQASRDADDYWLLIRVAD